MVTILASGFRIVIETRDGAINHTTVLCTFPSESFTRPFAFQSGRALSLGTEVEEDCVCLPRMEPAVEAARVFFRTLSTCLPLIAFSYFFSTPVSFLSFRALKLRVLVTWSMCCLTIFLSLIAWRYLISFQFLVVHCQHSLKLCRTLQLHFVQTSKDILLMYLTCFPQNLVAVHLPLWLFSFSLLTTDFFGCGVVSSSETLCGSLRLRASGTFNITTQC